MPGKRAVWKDFNAARAIDGRAGSRSEQPSKRRRLDPSRPNLRARLQPRRWPNGWLQIQAARINARHSRAKLQFDAELAKVACRALTRSEERRVGKGGRRRRRLGVVEIR